MQLRYLLAAGTLAALYMIAPGCSSSDDLASFALADPAVTLAPRVLPGGALEASVTARNSGAATWRTGEVALALAGGQGFVEGALALGQDTAPGASGTFTGKLTAPPRTGHFALGFQARHEGQPFPKSDAIQGETDVTCSDGVFCNGMERFVAGACVSGPDPCDDGADCTKDTCDEAKGTCSHELGANCASCISDCKPDCTGKVCGDNGCGGSCGECAMSEGCASAQGTCKPANQPGTCADPLPLLPAGTPLSGDHVIKGDTTNALHQATPTCNSTSRAVEMVYTFTLTEKTGIEARSSGYDTVLYLRKENPATPGSECLDDGPKATVACSDDSSPPGNYGSRIIAALDPGTYYLFVDGFDASQFGPFDLSVRLVPGGCVPHCDGVYCGGSDGCGNDCGGCDAGFACAKGRCKPSPCTPDCSGKECGDDGCDGECGTCAAGSLCVPASGKCQVFANCDHAEPTCTPPCGAGEFCGTDCGCHKANEAMPDLVVDEKRLAEEILFDTVEVNENSCSWVEKCVLGTGTRKVLRFSVEAKNQGQATLTVPPPDQRPDLFIYSKCHGHFHFNGFANYALLDKTGQKVVTGQKQAYCMEDTEQIAFGPDVPCDKKYTCTDQGIQKGWSDLYGNALDCQWLDITDIPAGEYRLQVSLNPGRVFEEVTLDNNVAEVPVTIP